MAKKQSESSVEQSKRKTILAKKSAPLLKKIGDSLGWPLIEEINRSFPDVPDVGNAIYAEAKASHRALRGCFIMFNYVFMERGLAFYVCLYALPIRICTGWHPLHFRSDGKINSSQWNDIVGFMAAHNFLDHSAREKYRKRFPTFTGFTNGKLGEFNQSSSSDIACMRLCRIDDDNNKDHYVSIL